MKQAHRVNWVDGNCEPRCPPNPEYPLGIDVDASHGAPKTCKVSLPYPAKRCGYYEVTCLACGSRASVTTAGRVDDPRSLTVACHRARGSQH